MISNTVTSPIKGAVSYGTLKFVDFEKIWHIKVTVIPQD